jgi:hypothetical protein
LLDGHGVRLVHRLDLAEVETALNVIRAAGVCAIYRLYHGEHEKPRSSTKGMTRSRDQAPQIVLQPERMKIHLQTNLEFTHPEVRQQLACAEDGLYSAGTA